MKFKRKKNTYDIVVDRIITATPLLCVIAYLFMGFIWNLWHPGWIVFILVFIMPSILKPKGFHAAFPIVILVVYLLLGFTLQWWHPGWVIFLFIPVFYILFPKKRKAEIDIDDDDNVTIHYS